MTNPFLFLADVQFCAIYSLVCACLFFLYINDVYVCCTVANARNNISEINIAEKRKRRKESRFMGVLFCAKGKYFLFFTLY